MGTEDGTTYERIAYTLELIRGELNLLRREMKHQSELLDNRIAVLEKQASDHETRLRDATTGVTQFRLWSTMSNGGSILMSLAALAKSFLP